MILTPRSGGDDPVPQIDGSRVFASFNLVQSLSVTVLTHPGEGFQ